MKAHRKTIPAAIMDLTRAAVIHELGDAASDIEEATLSYESWSGPGEFRALLRRFDELRGLVGAIGWSDADRSIDMRRYGPRLTAALETRLRHDRYFTNEPLNSPETRARVEGDIAVVESFLQSQGTGERSPLPSSDALQQAEERSEDAPALFANNVAELRHKKQLSQGDVSQRSGIHVTEISRIERGLRDPRLSTLVRLAHGLGVKPERLLDGC